jgi:hypothetical protein
MKQIFRKIVERYPELVFERILLTIGIIACKNQITPINQIPHFISFGSEIF